MQQHADLIAELESRFRELSALLYDTSVDPALADAAIKPLLAENVRFTDPWQEGTGRGKYRLGIAGFHAMFRFHLEVAQLNVQLTPDATAGRAIVDGIMYLKPLGRLFTYPLRTILVYDFTLPQGDPTAPPLLIHAHEEMWSLADMITALPVTGWVYRRVFRPNFARGFLVASWLSARARGMLPKDA